MDRQVFARFRRMLFWVLSASVLSGCGSSERGAAPAAEMVHPPGWLFEHDEGANEDLIGCQVCHGGDFRGNGKIVSCFSCHFSGPPFTKHPPLVVQRLEWRHPVNHGTWVKQDIVACQGCHGERGAPGSNPQFTRPFRRMEQGCESTEGCHGIGNDPFTSLNNGHNPETAHPSREAGNPAKQDRMHWYGERIPYLDDAGVERVQFVSHYNAGNLEVACALCHGAALQGGAGPACTACHVIPPSGKEGKCASCHGARPVQPANLFLAEVGRSAPLDPVFLGEVAAGVHLAHELLACGDRDSEQDCRRCHINEPLDGLDPRSNVNRHHLLVNQPLPVDSQAPFPPPSGLYSCSACHPLGQQQGSWQTEIIRDCAFCHHSPFPAALPCAETADP